MSNPHNLDIQSYDFYEILDLFHLEVNNITVDNLKLAKKKVLMMHPDKSNLPKEYFLFYKKAFDVLVRMFENLQKVSQPVEDSDYYPTETDCDVTAKQFQKTLGKISQKTFQHNFNELFDKHMRKPPQNPHKNDWFTQTDALYSEQAASSGDMGTVLEKIKEQQHSLTKYNGVVSMQFLSGGGSSLYHDEDDDEDENTYKCSEPFSKLKYDDLRKVHKDQTVFSVRESDFSRVPTYKSVDDYEQARDVRSVKPMEKTKAQQMLHEQELILQGKVMQKQYKSELVTMRHIDANKQVMSNFLRLK